jgi:hypothetical protein
MAISASKEDQSPDMGTPKHTAAQAQHALHKEFMQTGEQKNFDHEDAIKPKSASALGSCHHQIPSDTLFFGAQDE